MSVRLTDEPALHGTGVLIELDGDEVATVDYSIRVQREWVRAGGAYNPVGPERRGGQRMSGSLSVISGRDDFWSDRQPYALDVRRRRRSDRRRARTLEDPAGVLVLAPRPG
jgi:hypothetical protein